MSQSEKLRKNKNQHAKKNTESKEQDLIVKAVRDKVIMDMKLKYPEYEFGVDARLYIQEIEMLVNTERTTKDTTYIQPDGGFVWVKINNQKRYILVSEQKRQGTNDKLFLEGKDSQTPGNAAERLGKLVINMDTLYGNEKIIPMIVFLQGCDFFDEESTIADRIRTIMKFQKANQVNLYRVQLMEFVWFAGSYFMRGHSYKETPGSSDWTFEEMYKPMMEIAEGALKYFLNKYGE